MFAIATVGMRPAQASVIGFGDGVWLIDGTTGQVTQVEPGGGGWNTGGVSPSSIPGQYFFACPTCVDLHSYTVSGSQTGMQTDYFGQIWMVEHIDFAIDSGAGILYSASLAGDLSIIQYDSCYSGHVPTSPICLTAPGPAGVAGLQDIDFVPGKGIYGVSNDDKSLWLVNPWTGQNTLIGPTGIPSADGVMDLAYDAITGDFIASVLPGIGANYWGLSSADPGAPDYSMLYRIDPNSGAATLINGDAPVITGVAELAPEPATSGLLAVALLALAVAAKSKSRRRN